ncbi:MAG TPA: class C beta-lactamase, partial [Caulobacteraceae bacterium]
MTVVSRAFRHLVLIIIASSLLPIASRAADRHDQIAAAVDRAYRPLMQQYDVPGMAVAVTVDGRSYIFNFGVASRESHRPVTDDTLFELGSVSKTFTATLAAYAQVLGKLSLDDHPGRFMPQLHGWPIDRARLLDLGAYTAGGLPLQVPDAVTNDAEMATWLQQWKPEAAPGVERRYSNASIGLLGHVTALAMGGRFADVVETELFPRLGLRDSYIHVPAAQMPNYAWGYSRANAPIRVNPGEFDAEAYGIKTTAADMIHFVQENIGPGGLDGPMRQAVEATHVGYFDMGAMVQGLGWEQYPYPVTLDRLL